MISELVLLNNNKKISNKILLKIKFVYSSKRPGLIALLIGRCHYLHVALIFFLKNKIRMCWEKEIQKKTINFLFCIVILRVNINRLYKLILYLTITSK